jgi:hypothetical protein
MEEKRLTQSEWKEHIELEKKLRDEMHHIFFGNKEMGEVGLLKEHKEMYDILKTSRAVGQATDKLLGNSRKIALWIIAIGAAIAFVKGWLAVVIAWILNK